MQRHLKLHRNSPFVVVPPTPVRCCRTPRSLQMFLTVGVRSCRCASSVSEIPSWKSLFQAERSGKQIHVCFLIKEGKIPACFILADGAKCDAGGCGYRKRSHLTPQTELLVTSSDLVPPIRGRFSQRRNRRLIPHPPVKPNCGQIFLICQQTNHLLEINCGSV